MDRATTRYWLLGYAALGLLTFLFQSWVRLDQCQGAASCGLSLAKGLVWSAIWPASWIVYLAGFIPR